MNVFNDRVMNGNPTDPDILRSDFESKYPEMKEDRGTLAYDFMAECWLTGSGYAPLYDDTEPWEHEAGHR